MTVMTTRMFTHTGPRRGDVFAESTFAKQIAMIEHNLIPPVVKVGNLQSLRTVADVRDAVRAYYMLVTVNPTPGAYYNIGGNHSCTVERHPRYADLVLAAQGGHPDRGRSRSPAADRRRSAGAEYREVPGAHRLEAGDSLRARPCATCSTIGGIAWQRKATASSPVDRRHPDTAIPRKVDDTQMLMAISRTPYRVSFFGGGTDYPAWYRRHGGAVLSMAINKYCYIRDRLPAAILRHPSSHHLVPYRGGRSDFRDPAPCRAGRAADARLRRHAGHRAVSPGRSAGALGHRLELGLRRRPDQRPERDARREPRRACSRQGRDRTSSRTSSRKASAARTRSPAPTAASTSSSSRPTTRSRSRRLASAIHGAAISRSG